MTIVVILDFKSNFIKHCFVASAYWEQVLHYFTKRDYYDFLRVAFRESRELSSF